MRRAVGTLRLVYGDFIQSITLHERITVDMIRKAALLMRGAVQRLARQLYLLNLLGASNQAAGTRVPQYTVFKSDFS